MIEVVGLLGFLLLVGRCPLEPADRGHGAQQPGKLCVLGAMALDEQRAAVRIQPEGEQRRGHLAGPAAQHVGIVKARQGVVVDDAVDRLELGLERDVVANRAEIVAEVDDPGRLDAAEDAPPRGRSRRGGRNGSWFHGSCHGWRV